MTGPTIRVACLGAGYFSQFHLDAWQRIDGAKLVAVADADLTKAQAVGVASFAELLQMLAAVKPDLLDIVVPPAAHLAAIKTAVEYGVKAIICQKPFCQSLDEANEATNLAEAAGTTLIIHENFRFQPWYRAIGKAIEQLAIGEVQQMTFRFRTGDGQGPRAYLDRQPYFQTMPRLLIHETAVHWIDTFQFLLGPVRAVYGDLRRLNAAIVGEDAGYVVFDFDNGVRALFDGNRHLDHSAENHRLTLGEALVEGTKGTLSLTGDGALHQRAFGEVSTQCLLQPDVGIGFAGDCVHALQQHVIAGMLAKTPLENTAREYLRVLEIEAVIYQSAQEKRKLDI